MGKRFTETGKWSKQWFRSLKPVYKCAWNYLTETCDPAGVIELDRDLANFQIGESVDWDDFLKIAGSRTEVIRDGKLWIVGFIDFQYGKISEACKAHRPVFASLEKHGLNERVLKGYPKGINTLKEKDKDKDKEKDTDMEGGVGETVAVEVDDDERSFIAARDRFTALWNAAPGVRSVTVMSGRRVAMFRKRLTEQVLIGVDRVPWLDGLERMLKEKFPLKCTRGSPSNWMPDVDWILDETALPSIIEGKYDWEKNDGRQRAIGPGQRFDSATTARPPSVGWK